MKEKKMAKQNQSQNSTRKRVASQTINDDEKIVNKVDQPILRSQWTKRNIGENKFYET